jgi:energy-coupling factor transporter ATP-binding protein EcfA2
MSHESANLSDLSVRDLVVGFGRRVVLIISLDVRKGEILGLVGGSGSGKSVLMRTIIGLIAEARRPHRSLWASISRSTAAFGERHAVSSGAGASCFSRARCSRRSPCAEYPVSDARTSRPVRSRS